MPTSFLENWFSIDTRRNRLSFLLSHICLIAIFLIFMLIRSLFANTENGKGLGLIVFGVPATICSYLLVAQRLRDFNVNGWFSLLWIPINAFDPQVRAALTVAAMVVLCGIPGTSGPNKFGDDPIN